MIKRILQNRYFSYWVVLLMDLFIAALSILVSVIGVRYFGGSNAVDSIDALGMFVVGMPLTALCFYLFRTYRNIIRHSSLKGLWSIGVAVILKAVAFYVLLHLVSAITMVERAIIMAVLLDFMICLFGMIGVRVVMLIVYDWIVVHSKDQRKTVLVYGVTEKSVALTTRLFNSTHYHIVGFLTFGKKMSQYKISEHKVYYFNNEEEFAKVVESVGVNAILFAGEEDVRNEKERLLKYCSDRQPQPIQVLIAPQVDELNSVNASKVKMKNIRIEDLLGRDEIHINREEIYKTFHDKVVMVTGGAGSIGSEICRQMASLGVKKLVIFDIAETPLHEIRLELEKNFPDLDFVPFIGDVRSAKRLQIAFDRYQPEIVFHAAAYKHVPLMEENPCEAVLSNVQGSKNVADLCVRNGVDKVVMISTDKAVNPTNVMGCSKRLAEIYCQSYGMAIAQGTMGGKTKFVTTRFGNVLGSNGSVIPHFSKQIEQGGPVTVTHPQINRFFMTIPEACRLVMEAASMSNGNEIFVFEMGEPVLIADLAERMIRLAGYVPGQDIEIKFTGLRPGEKLYEEVLSNEENTIPTDHHKIKIAKVREYDFDRVCDDYEALVECAKGGDVMATVRRMKEIVPEFKSNNSKFEEIDKELEAEEAQTA
ncbi:MAG: polysaccharide biosynthesis protein [Tidjanibacter sp.]|nr:polysaccharide biosynthesis protein [Tidjanibacter sp.]